MSSQQKGFQARMKETTGFSDEAVSVDFIHMYAGEFLCAQMLGRDPGPAVRVYSLMGTTVLQLLIQ